MPNRIIKEGIRTSKKINALTDFQFRLWTYLITYVDDFGRGSAEPDLVKGLVFPRRGRVTESDIKKALAELAGMGCINLYDVDGESYFYFPNWGDHQRIQTKKSKFPEPLTVTDASPQSSTVNHGDSPPESNPNTNPNPESESNNAQALFDTFWEAYPKKKSKGDAEKAWGVIKPSKELVAIMLNKLAQVKTCKDWLKDGGQYIPYPATWLRAKGWEDEISTEQTHKSTGNDFFDLAREFAEEEAQMEEVVI